MLYHSFIVITLAIRTRKARSRTDEEEAGCVRLGPSLLPAMKRYVESSRSLEKRLGFVCKNIKMETVRALDITSVSLSM